MFKGLGDLASIMKQAPQMGSMMQDVAQQLKTQRVVGSAGGGMVEVEANGAGDVLRVTIEPSLVENDEREMIEDLIPAAVNQALQKAKQLHADAMKDAAGGLNIPGLNQALGEISNDGS